MMEKPVTNAFDDDTMSFQHYATSYQETYTEQWLRTVHIGLKIYVIPKFDGHRATA